MELKLGHYRKDGIEVVTVEGQIDISTAPRLRDLLIDLAATGSYQLIVNLDQVGFPGLHRPRGAGRRAEAGPAA